MKNPIFKKTIFISLLGHITVFSIFGFSFGSRIPKVGYTNVYFWGQFLQNFQVLQPIPNSTTHLETLPTKNSNTLALHRTAREPPLLSDWRKKPPFTPPPIAIKQKPNTQLVRGFTLAFNKEKEVFIEKPAKQLFFSKRREQTIIFHPLLPYGFTLYFKDRQVAHVELMFKMASAGTGNSILLKRKISSGNLEVDLMALRYIGHYLFIQQPNAPANNWQTVKIDLSAKND